MDLTLKEAAAQLGKSLRQVRYMVTLGKLPAKKVGMVWQIDSTALPPSPGQMEAAARKDQQLRAAVEEALDGKDKPDRPRYSMRNLRAVQVALPIQRACEADLGTNHPSTAGALQCDRAPGARMPSVCQGREDRRVPQRA